VEEAEVRWKYIQSLTPSQRKAWEQVGNEHV